MRRWVVAGVIGALVVATVVLRSARSPDSPSIRHGVGTEQYRPGLDVELFVPGHVRRAPLVVLIPGGGWVTADPAGLRPLADRLAASGIASATGRYRAADDGARFPVPARDVSCAIDFAAARARQVGVTPTAVIALGHSAGAHLAALVALTGERFHTGCRYPSVPVTGLIGLAGPYDIVTMPNIAHPLFERSVFGDPATWRSADPLTWVRERPALPVLLIHGAADRTVPPSSTTSFAAALRRGGHEVQVHIVPGADHASIYRPQVVADRIIGWVESLVPSAR